MKKIIVIQLISLVCGALSLASSTVHAGFIQNGIEWEIRGTEGFYDHQVQGSDDGEWIWATTIQWAEAFYPFFIGVHDIHIVAVHFDTADFAKIDNGRCPSPDYFLCSAVFANEPFLEDEYGQTVAHVLLSAYDRPNAQEPNPDIISASHGFNDINGTHFTGIIHGRLSFRYTSVPIPASLVFFLSALVGLIEFKRRAK